jgi:hypothetical protein
MQHPFKTVGQSTIVKELMQIVHDDSPWIPYYNFTVKPVPPEVTNQDPFLAWLSSRHAFIGGVVKMDPYTQYDWHVDTRRGVGINMLLTARDNSLCMFTERPADLVKNIYPLNYQDQRYYLFNTQQPHSVINKSDTRYLFTIEFGANKDHLSFNDLKKEIKDGYDTGKES